jgi:uncharacterized protein (DUF849 family)
MATVKSGKVINSCVITGSIHTSTMSGALPIRAEDIATQATEAAEAAAASLHLHARDRKDGRPTPDLAVHMRFLPRIKQAAKRGRKYHDRRKRSYEPRRTARRAPAREPEMCSLNIATMNFGIFSLADRYTSWQHDRERSYLRGSDDFIFRNTFRDIERIIKTLGEEHGIRFEHECYDIGHLYNLAHVVDKKLVKLTVLRSDDIPHLGRHRRRSSKSDVHEGNRRLTIRS